MRANGSAGLDDPVEIVAAGHVTEDQQTRQQAEATNPRHCQRHASAVAGAGILVPVADQKE